MHGGRDNRIFFRWFLCGVPVAGFFCLFLYLTAPVFPEPGITYNPVHETHWLFAVEPPPKDTIVRFEGGRLLPQPPLTATPTAARSPWALNLGTGWRARHDSLDLRTYLAFRELDGVKGGWNKSVTALLKQSDREKRGELKVGIELPKAMQSIVGEGGAGLKVSGNQRILFAGRSNWTDAQNVSAIRQSKFPSLRMEQISRFMVDGTIGSKITVHVDQDSKRTTDLENRIVLRYKGEEDDILQSVDLGNTTLSLADSRFIGYSERIQGLFGISATAKVGPVDMKMIASQEKGNTSRSRLTAGANEQNIYIRDYDYDRYRFYDLAKVGNTTYWTPGDTVLDFQLFQSVGYSGQGDVQTEYVAVKDWQRLDTVDQAVRTWANDSVKTWFRELSLGVDYYLIPDSFYVFFPRRLQNIQTAYLAYYMRVKRGEAIIEFGDALVQSEESGRIPIHLQLLKRSSPTPDDSLWNTEWKNVYDLRLGRDISYNDFLFDIFKGRVGDEENPANLNFQDSLVGGGDQDSGDVQDSVVHVDSRPFMQILDLDRINGSGQPKPDGRLDNTNAVLDTVFGLVIFPDRLPFADTALRDSVPTLYTTANERNMRDSSKYYVKITTRRRSERVRLGSVNIIEGSEVVTFGGRRLVNGSDYNIDYSIGEITFLRPEVLDEQANVTIDYEYIPFISAEKRTLFGLSARYDPAPNFKTGTTLLYKGTKATDRPAQLGSEPYRDVVAEQFLNWSAQPEFLTRLTDALPLVEATAPSRLDFSAAAARSMPNPNSKGDVIIDDFEGTSRPQGFGVLRESWSIASPPLVIDRDNSLRSYQSRGLHDRGLIWFNPYDQFLETDIYDRSKRQRTVDSRTHVLVLEFRPDLSPTRDSGETDPVTRNRGAWGGIMRSMPASLWDQSRALYLEVRMAVASLGTSPGALHIDLGRIQEDVNNNDTLETEDNLLLNGLLDEDEKDWGLDGRPDSCEADTTCHNTDPDPAGDNWTYSQTERNNYEKINGTEGNSVNDPIGGRRPDSENLDDESGLQQTNAYYEFTIPLDGTAPFLVDTIPWTSGDRTGFAGTLEWRTYRIPVWDTTYYDKFRESPTADADSNQIRFARLWIDSADAKTRVYIAAIDVVQPDWRPKAPSRAGNPTPTFQLGVVNSEENPGYYSSPPGVSGYTDRTGFTEREQSLQIKYTNFSRNDEGRATIAATGSKEDYTGYRSLKMWVHPDARAGDDSTTFEFRFGQDARNYYFYRRPLHYATSSHDDTWRANEMAIDFNTLTALKDTANFEPSLRGYYAFDSTRSIGVFGNPSLANVTFREIILTRYGPADSANSGDVWFDQLRLTDVRKDPGLAAAGKLTLQLSDFIGVTAQLEGQNYSFRQLNQGRSTSLLAGQTRLKSSWFGNISLHKFFPQALGLSLPLSVNYGRDVSRPRLLTGSDVVLTPERQEDQKSTTVTEGASISASIKPKTKNWIVNSTIGAVNTRFSASRSWSVTPVTPYRYSETYNAAADYRLKFGKRLAFSPMFWTRYFLFPRKLWATRLSVLPTEFRANGAINRSLDSTTNNQGLTTRGYARSFQGASGIAHQPIPALSVNYDMSTQRDLARPEELVLTTNPSRFRLGRELGYTQKVSSNYRPTLFSFFSPTGSYTASFADKIDRISSDHDVTVDRSWSLGGGFDLAKFWTSIGGTKEKSRSKAATPTRPRWQQPDTTKTGPPAPDSAAPPPQAPAPGGSAIADGWRSMIGGLRFLTSPIGPLNVTYSRGEGDAQRDLTQRPPQFYQLGWRLDRFPKLVGAGSGRSNVDTRTRRTSLGVKNDLRFFGALNFSSAYSRTRSETEQERSRNSTEGEVFPSLRTSFAKLEKIRPLSWIFSNATASFGYERKKDKALQGEQVNSETVTESFSPLLQLSGMTRKAVQLTLTLDRSSTTSRPRLNLDNKRVTRSVRVTSNYTFSSPHGIPLPFLRGLRLKSQMNVQVAVTRRVNENFNEIADTANVGTGGFRRQQRGSEFTVNVNMSYSFSTRLRGGLQADWTDRSQTNSPDTHSRGLGISAEFNF